MKRILGDFLDWNNARLECFTHILMALFAVRTVNLKAIALAFATEALVDSRYRRIRRFFAQCIIDSDVIARWAFHLFFHHHPHKLLVTIDRTNWFRGKSKINVFMLGIKYEGVSIPLLWTLLDKAGNATAVEHRALVERFIKLFGKECIGGILGDREFASGDFFGWCNEQDIPFYIRIKEGSQVRVGYKKLCKAIRLFADLAPNTRKHFDMTIRLYGQWLYLAGSRSERGELMIIATNRCPKKAICMYLMRWEIENLFSCLKTRGFQFEDTHLTHLERIDKLMTLLCVGFCWAHKVGEWRATLKPIRFNQYRDGKRPQYSFFRYGLDWIREAILHIDTKAKQFADCLAQLIAPDRLTDLQLSRKL